MRETRPRSPARSDDARLRSNAGVFKIPRKSRGAAAIERLSRTFLVESWHVVAAAPWRLATLGGAALAAEWVYEAASTVVLDVGVSEATLHEYTRWQLLRIIIAALMVPLPLALLGGGVRAWLAPRYFCLQARALGEGTAPLAPRQERKAFAQLWLVDLVASAALPMAASLAALPGMLLAIVALLAASRRLLAAAFVLSSLGAVLAVAYVLPGVVFATRWVVLSGYAPRAAIAANWTLAKGQRRRILGWIVPMYLAELAGLLGLCVFLIGALVTMPLARAARDTMITRLFLRLTSPRP